LLPKIGHAVTDRGGLIGSVEVVEYIGSRGERSVEIGHERLGQALGKCFVTCN
jgi:hypothetical protein